MKYARGTLYCNFCSLEHTLMVEVDGDQLKVYDPKAPTVIVMPIYLVDGKDDPNGINYGPPR